MTGNLRGTWTIGCKCGYNLYLASCVLTDEEWLGWLDRDVMVGVVVDSEHGH